MIIPSIDLQNGKAVQLEGGKRLILEREDVDSLAKEFNIFADIAVVDLDAALERGDNNELVRKICQIGTARVGGGIRTTKRAKEILSFGASQIIVGTSAFENDRVNKEFLSELAEVVGGERVIVAIDSLYGEIVTKGWKHKTGIITSEVVERLEEFCSGFLFTIVEREGRLGGTDQFLIRNISSKTKNRLTVAGGITTINELKKISQLGADAQIGMALYENILKLDECFVEMLDWKKQKLIPTITQDEQGQVLMLGYSSKESLYKTFSTKNVTYFSRSRKRLWTKGETSGNFQKFIKIRTDCDSDTLLITANQIGNACHLDRYSCFADKEFSLEWLYKIIKNRLNFPQKVSYTAKLKDKKLLAFKIMEEAGEVIDANTTDEKVWEVADLLYFLTTFMATNEISFAQVLNELQRRHLVKK